MIEWLKSLGQKWKSIRGAKYTGDIGDIGPIEDVDKDGVDNADNVDSDDEMDEETRIFMENIIGNIGFILSKDGQIRITSNFYDLEPEVAKKFGEFLFLLNSGRVSLLIGQHLSQISNKDIVYLDFTTQVLKGWINAEDQINETPLIAPSEVFNLQEIQE